MFIDTIIRHICERPDGGPDNLMDPDTIVTTVAELREAIAFALQPIIEKLGQIGGSINRGDCRECFYEALAELQSNQEQ